MDYIISEHVKIRNINDDINRLYDILSDYGDDIGLKDKEYLKLRLLTEEVLRLVKQIIVTRSVELWYEGNSRVSRIILESEAVLDDRKKVELGSLSTSGTVYEEKGFFRKLIDLFLIDTPQEDTWSLKEYERQIKAKREEDKYSLEAWDNLERSLVSNLADDIEISTSKDVIKMVVTKDFTGSLSYIPSYALEKTSRQIFVGSGKDIIAELEKADDIIEELSLDNKNAIHAKLIFEETLGMLKGMTDNYKAVIWLEKYKKSYCLKFVAKTQMDYGKKQELLSVSTDKKNSSIKGVMDKIGDMIQNEILGYENATKMAQEYGGVYLDYNAMGRYSSVEGLPEYGMMWSLNDYRECLDDINGGDSSVTEDSKFAWDELEKSIVANIANDILVGVKGDNIEMTIICKMK